MKKIFFILTVILVTCSLVNAQAPVINSFSPTTGFVGSTVTITGANFDGSAAANNQVFFGSAEATVLTASFGTLTVSVPAGSTSSLISVRNVTTKLTGYSRNHFNAIFCSTPLNSTTYAPFNTAAGDQQISGINGAYNIDIYDMDGDGKSDIVTGKNDGGLTIARNNSTIGTMNFVATNITTSGAFVQQFFVADFDGDGKRDIVISGSQGAFIFPNLSTPGTISFGARVTLTTAFAFYQCAAGDLDNDGKIDFVASNGVNLRTFRNLSSGPGDFSFSTVNTSVNVGFDCNGIQCVDMDGDGKQDIIATQRSGNRIIALRNTTTTSTFSFAATQLFSTVSAGPYRLKLGDFDKDGLIDLVMPLYEGARTCIFRNISTIGAINFQTPLLLTASANNYRVGVGDVNGDGLPDVVTKPNGVGTIFQVFQNTSTGPGVISFNPFIEYNSSAGSEVGGIAIGDMDGDFVPDIATSGITSNVIRFHRNKSAQVDNTAPTAICKNIIVALSPSGTVTVTGAMIDNGSGDACGLAPFKINGVASLNYGCADLGNHTVTLTVTDLAGNTATCTSVVTVAAAAITVSGQTTVCQGQSVLLTANQGNSYQWQKNGVDIPGAVNQTYSATESGSYIVTVNNPNPGCSGTSAPLTITVNNNPTVAVTPDHAFLCPPGLNALLTASLSSIYQWKLNGNNISGATQQTYNVITPGNYSVQVIDLFGCTATSDPVVVSATPPEIDVKGNGVSIADGDMTPSGADHTDFGTTFPATPVVRIFEISNSGLGALIVSSINISGADAANFTLGGITLPATIGIGGTASFTLTFNGTGIQVYNAEVIINNDDCNEPIYNYAVRAEISCVPPSFSNCPGNIAVSNNNNVCGAAVTYNAVATGIPAPVLNYLFSGATTGSGPGTGSGSAFNIGVTNVSITATSSCGLATCTFTVTVTDNQPPTITCPPALTVQCASQVPPPNTALVTANDNCAGVTVSWVTDNIIPGSCPNRFTVSRIYRATDAAGNSTTCTQTITVFDDTAPTIICPQPVTVQCASQVPAPDLESVIVSDNCGDVTITWVGDVIDQQSCANRYFVYRTYRATDACNNSTICIQLINVFDDTPPVITCPNPVTVQCGGAVPAPNATSVVASDNCGPVTVSWVSDEISNQTCANRYTITRTYMATDACNNSTTCTQLITVFDNTAPTFTCPANKTILFTGACTYVTNPANTGSPTNIMDNCGGVVAVTFTDMVSQCGYNTVVSRKWKATDVCGNSTTCIQTITISDNNTPYVIYASKEAKFGEDNDINGDVGVTDANGKAEFKKGSMLDPYHVYAKNITVHLPATVNFKHFVPATGGPNPSFVIYAGGGLSGNHNQTVSGVVPAGNFKNLTIKKGVAAIVNGNNYGKISVEENASITFTNASIDIEEFKVEKGKSPGNTMVYFTKCTGVRVKDKVNIEDNSRVNVGGPRVIFYMGDNKKDEEKFTVKNDNTQVTVNILMPNGKLKVHGGNGNCIMTGWFIVEKFDSEGKNVTWNKYDCAPLLISLVQPPAKAKEDIVEAVVNLEKPAAIQKVFEVRAYPNPSSTSFGILVNSQSMEPVTIRLMDIAGNVLSVITKVTKGALVNLGSDLRGGTYMAEVIQGTNMKTVKLVKLD